MAKFPAADPVILPPPSTLAGWLGYCRAIRAIVYAFRGWTARNFGTFLGGNVLSRPDNADQTQWPSGVRPAGTYRRTPACHQTIPVRSFTAFLRCSLRVPLCAFMFVRKREHLGNYLVPILFDNASPKREFLLVVMVLETRQLLPGIESRQELPEINRLSDRIRPRILQQRLYPSVRIQVRSIL